MHCIKQTSLPGGVETIIKDLKSQWQVTFDKSLLILELKYQNNSNETKFVPTFLRELEIISSGILELIKKEIK